MCIIKSFPVIEMHDLYRFKRNDILVCKLSEYLYTQTFLHLPHKHDFYQLILFTEGGGYVNIDFHQVEACPFHIFFLLPGQLRVWGLMEDTEGFRHVLFVD